MNLTANITREFDIYIALTLPCVQTSQPFFSFIPLQFYGLFITGIHDQPFLWQFCQLFTTEIPLVWPKSIDGFVNY